MAAATRAGIVDNIHACQRSLRLVVGALALIVALYLLQKRVRRGAQERRLRMGGRSVKRSLVLGPP